MEHLLEVPIEGINSEEFEKAVECIGATGTKLKILHPRVSSITPEITYVDPVLPPMAEASLPPLYSGVDVQDSRLSDALGEIVVACRARGLSALAAIVGRNDTRSPATGAIRSRKSSDYR